MISLSITGAIATLCMSRPPVNAIDTDFITRFEDALADIERQHPVVVVLQSDQKCFSAGADLALIRQFFDAADGPEAMHAYVRALHRIFDRLEALPAVTVAAIAGPALGGGLELALACDLRVATEDARLGLPEARVGMIPGAGGTQRLARLCGPGVANRLILSADIVDGREAERLGLVQWSAKRADFEGTVREIARRIGGLSRQALVESKACILGGLDKNRDGYAMELSVPARLMRTEEARSRVSQFFAPKSAPQSA